MKTVILCGGQGTRIRDVNETLPKPLLPIGDKPILWHIMKGYAAGGLKDFVLCLGYKGWQIKDFFINYQAKTSDVVVRLGKASSLEILNGGADEDWSVLLAETGEATLTGGRVAAVRGYLEGAEPFCLTYGDGVADIDMRSLVEFHKRHGKIATVTAVRPPSRFGEMALDGSLVQEFNEKPQTTGGFINGGFMVFDGRKIWDYIDGRPELILEREPLQRLAADGQLVAYQHDGFWQPMDTLREFTLLNQLWSEGKAPWKTWDRAAFPAK
jgi:glucose-1-phosphate cytidylyltransferase